MSDVEREKAELAAQLVRAQILQGQYATDLRQERALRSAAELRNRNIQAAIQTVLNFGRDQPPPAGQWYIDPDNGQASFVSAVVS